MVVDMTKGKPIKVISKFALPLFVGSVFQQVYTLVDSIVVGNFVGSGALAAVGVCTGAFNLLIALVMGLTNGMGVVMSQYFGAKKYDMVKKAFISAMIINLSVGILLTAAGIFLTEPLLQVLDTPQDIMGEAKVYLTIMFLGTLANCMYNGMSAVLRSLGDSVIPLVVLVMASLLNVGLDLLFVIVFRMGVAGVAIATVLAQLVSAVFCIIYAFGKLPFLRFRREEFKIENTVAGAIIRVGFSAALSSVGVSLSVMFMQRVINAYGSTVIAAYTVGNRAENVGLSLAFSIGMSVGTFCGQNIGAEDFGRVHQGMRVGHLIAITYAVVVGASMFLLAKPLAGLFTSESEVVDIAATYIYVASAFAPVLGLVFVYQNFLRSAGDVMPTVWMSITEIVARSVLAFFLSWKFGYIGIWFATPVGWVASLLIGIWRYRSGKWKTKLTLGHA